MLDAITLSMVQKRLDHIAKQIGAVMIRTSRSPIFSQSHDFSCFLTDASGQLVTQADGIPIHTGSGGFSVRAVLKAFGSKLQPGDVFISNDPYVAGGNHLPDWVIARPIFCLDELVAFACIRAHQSDIGGGAAGTYNSAATEIFHEGIRLPVLKLGDRAGLREDIWQLLMINSRTPHLLDGDLRAMLGGTQVGHDQVVKMAQEMGPAMLLEYLEGILGHADQCFRMAISDLRPGVYKGEDGFDDDCFEPVKTKIVVSIGIADDGVTVDFTGSDPQMRGFKNSSLANTHSAVFMALASFLDPALPRNEGTFRSVKIIAPAGTVVNARAPAPVGYCTSNPAHQIVQACWQALGKVDPGRSCAGWGKKLIPITAGKGADNRTFVLYHWGANSGGGAVAGRDGLDQIGPLETLGGLFLPNAEIYEQLYPVRVWKQEFRCDAGGPGKFRGGTGIHYVADVLSEGSYSLRAEGVLSGEENGTNGGHGGARGEIRLAPCNDEAFVPPTYGVAHYAPIRVDIRSPAGGGWGNPAERDPELVRCDCEDGLVSVEAARSEYLVAIKSDLTVDWDATSSLRAKTT